MKPATMTDLRMVLLMQELGSKNLLEAIGLMEATWHFADRYAPDGMLPIALARLLAASVHFPAVDGLVLLSAIAEAGWGEWDEKEEVLRLVEWDRVRPVAQQARNRMRNYRVRVRPPLVVDEEEDVGVAQRDHENATPPPPPPVKNTSRCATPPAKGEEGGGGGVGVSDKGAHTRNPSGSEAEAEPPPLAPAKGKPKKKKTTKYPEVAEVVLPESLDSPLVFQALTTWLDHRRVLHRGITLTGVHLLLKRYENRPAEFIRDVEYSVGNGWQGVFSPDEKAATTRNGHAERPLLSPTIWSTYNEDAEPLPEGEDDATF